MARVIHQGAVVRRISCLILAAAMAAAPARAAAPFTAVGVWRNPKDSVHIALRPCGAEICGFVVWASILAIFRVSSVGSLAGAVVAVVVGFLVHRPIEYPWVAVIFLVLMLFTHRSNLQRLINRQENRV